MEPVQSAQEVMDGNSLRVWGWRSGGWRRGKRSITVISHEIWAAVTDCVFVHEKKIYYRFCSGSAAIINTSFLLYNHVSVHHFVNMKEAGRGGGWRKGTRGCRLDLSGPKSVFFKSFDVVCNECSARLLFSLFCLCVIWQLCVVCSTDKTVLMRLCGFAKRVRGLKIGVCLLEFWENSWKFQEITVICTFAALLLL